MSRDKGLDYLLELDGEVFVENNGYWHKFDIKLTNVTK